MSKTTEYDDFLYNKLTSSSDNPTLEPRRFQEWEKQFIEKYELHMEINHLQNCLREIVRCSRLSVAKQMARTALGEE